MPENLDGIEVGTLRAFPICSPVKAVTGRAALVPLPSRSDGIGFGASARGHYAAAALASYI